MSSSEVQPIFWAGLSLAQLNTFGLMFDYFEQVLVDLYVPLVMLKISTTKSLGSLVQDLQLFGSALSHDI